jgi:hypothetical protein
VAQSGSAPGLGPGVQGSNPCTPTNFKEDCMNTVIDSNELCRKYDYSSLITATENDTAIGIIKSIIESGNYFTNSPPFQTKENLFGRPEPVWLKYRMTFLTSVFLYLGHEAKVSGMMAWSFMTNLKTQENRDTYWHHHNKHSGKSLKRYYVLTLPDDVKDFNTCGTEMAPNGPESDGKFLFVQVIILG